MKSIVIAIVVVLSFMNEIQGQLNEYKYIVVPKRLDGFSKDNQYKTSTLVKHLFTQKGFNVVYEDNLPTDLNANKCLGLFVNLLDESSLFSTKTALILKDCNGTEVFTTMQGKSKSKEYEPAYSEAINKAFSSFDGIVYNYQPKQEEAKNESLTVSFKNDVKKLEAPNERGKSALVEEEFTSERQYYKDNRPVDSDFRNAETAEGNRTMVEQTATREAQRFESIELKPSEMKIAKSPSEKTTTMFSGTPVTLYAQELPDGYQLVDSTPKIQMKLFKSSMPNVYIAESGSINGLVYAEGGKWFFEYYNANKLVTELLNIKF